MKFTTVRATTLTVVAATAALIVVARAEEPMVKPEASPVPTAGPTVAATQEFCGDPTGSAAELIRRYSGDAKLKEVYKDNDYIAYSDDPKNSTVMYTFTTATNPAHPAAVCRKPERAGDNIVIKMVVVCDGPKDPCAKLQNDFNVLTARMQVEADQQMKKAN